MSLPVELLHSVPRLRHVAYVDLASLVYNLADYMQTSEWEYEYIWGERKWTPVKVTYVIGRYLGLIDYPLAFIYHHMLGLTPTQCNILFDIAGCSALTGATFGEILMFLRVYILSGCSKIVGWYLTIHFSVLLLVIFACAIVYLKSLVYSPSPFPTLIACYMSHSNRRYLSVMYGVVLVHQITVMFLSLWFGLRNFRHSRNPLLLILYRDGTLYFIILSAVSIANVAVVIAGPFEYQTLFLTAQRALHSTLSTRIILKMREMARRDLVFRSMAHASHGGLQFADVDFEEDGSIPRFTSRQHEFIAAGGPAMFSKHLRWAGGTGSETVSTGWGPDADADVGLATQGRDFELETRRSKD
ncbi:hypothetical protein FA15DRAFT_708368 [Coprinopsis marcescibilis]|uniref:DUF6533 domain-containing protein n=1 Tax=Coprinopsis marcescibilis TaxID=230819 RepID=A0A5C3KJL5_COPMA|nr:hypothetical protein FA15DRAFT_708368 [Coprinopsis marcescibilis]